MQKLFLIQKYKKKGIGLNAISSYKRASNILDKAGKGISGRPDAVLFRKEEEKVLHGKINEIRKAFTVNDENKDYESLLIKLSDTKESTDNFFDNVVVNDENNDIKNNQRKIGSIKYKLAVKFSCFRINKSNYMINRSMRDSN